jgi:serine/threonine protein kinase
MSEPSANSKCCPQCGAPLPEAPDSLCPRCLMAHLVQPTQLDGPAAQEPFAPEELAPLFPHLEILECLGRGGMGVVYKARQKSLNRFVALKLLAPERAGDADFAARFAREAQALAALNHPHIVAVYDFGEAGGFYFLLMEFVDGVNLRQLLRTKRLTPKEALSIVPPVCDALQCAHDRGIVHRDIKPENLLLDRNGTIKIADFGIAKMLGDIPDGGELHSSHSSPSSHRTISAGTPAYAAPEQQGGAADHRADIYSLGVVLYEMLTGERPKDRLDRPSRRVQVDVRIDEIVLRALETSPEMRFATVAEFRTQVDAVRSSLAPSPRSSPLKWAALILDGLAVASAAYTITQNRSQPSPGTPISHPVRQPFAMTLPDTVAEFESAYGELLNAERAAALAATGADDAPQRTQRLRDLRTRVAELERRILTLSETPPANPPAKYP